MTVDLSRLRELAEESKASWDTLGPDIETDWYDAEDLRTLDDEFDTALIVACDPVTVLALVRIAQAAAVAATDDPKKLAGAVEHASTCGIWVELDDVTGALHPIGECDCGLDALRASLSVLTDEGAT